VVVKNTVVPGTLRTPSHGGEFFGWMVIGPSGGEEVMKKVFIVDTWSVLAAVAAQ
jgi:hypothetical protein